jgi:hypothetical protein
VFLFVFFTAELPLLPHEDTDMAQLGFGYGLQDDRAWDALWNQNDQVCLW